MGDHARRASDPGRSCQAARSCAILVRLANPSRYAVHRERVPVYAPARARRGRTQGGGSTPLNSTKLGGCDIFVQSVIPTLDQIYEHTLATEVTLAKWQIAFDTQSRAFFVGAPAAAKHMSPGGRILALSYKPGGVTGGWQPWVGMGSAKAAVESMCRYFAVALARHGITVNAVSPGPSDETTVIGQTPKEVRDAPNEWVSAGWTPMRRRVTPSDVANVCALLCSDEASFLTGQTIVVDGGSSLMNPDFPLALHVPT